MLKIKKKTIIKCVEVFLEWLIYMLAYTLVFICTSFLFDSFIISNDHLYLYSFMAVVLIFILNKTVKPILFKLTLPITGLTMGLFYFVINMIILKIVELLMNNNVQFTDLFVLFFISVLLSLLNVLMENVIVKPFMKKVKTYE